MLQIPPGKWRRDGTISHAGRRDGGTGARQDGNGGPWEQHDRWSSAGEDQTSHPEPPEGKRPDGNPNRSGGTRSSPGETERQNFAE